MPQKPSHAASDLPALCVGHPVLAMDTEPRVHMLWAEPARSPVCRRYLTLAKGTGPDKVNSYGIGVNAEREIGTARLAAYVRATFDAPAAAADQLDS